MVDRPVAAVTGGAGGIGSAICSAFAEAGFNVAVGYASSKEKATALAANLQPGSHLAVSMPVADSRALTAAANLILQQFGRIDVLVNCAGTTRFVAHDDLDALDDELIDLIFQTNVRGAIATVRAFHKLLATSDLPGGGVVVNISSTAGVTAMGSNVAYCASKAALDNVTRSLARALAPQVRVISVAPGLVDTEFVQSLSPAWRDEQLARTPLRRLAAPDDVGAAVVAAVRTLPFATGTVLLLDGGRGLG